MFFFHEIGRYGLYKTYLLVNLMANDILLLSAVAFLTIVYAHYCGLKNCYKFFLCLGLVSIHMQTLWFAKLLDVWL